MYVIWKVHVLTLNYYKNINNIEENDIAFLFKGGDYLSKLAKTFWTSLPSHAVRYLISEYEKYFKKSDLDYTIYINVFKTITPIRKVRIFIIIMLNFKN